MIKTVKAVKVFDIEIEAKHLFGHGYDYWEDGYTFVKEEIWESEKQCEETFKRCTAEFHAKRATDETFARQFAEWAEIKVKTYWKILEETVEETKA